MVISDSPSHDDIFLKKKFLIIDSFHRYLRYDSPPFPE